RFDWNHKTIVTNRDELVLNRLSGALHQSFKRARDARTQHRDLVTNARELRTRAVVELTARKNFIRNTCDEYVEIARQVFHQLPQHWRILTFGENGAARRHRLVTEPRGLQNREWIKTRAFDAQTRDRFAWIS